MAVGYAAVCYAIDISTVQSDEPNSPLSSSNSSNNNEKHRFRKHKIAAGILFIMMYASAAFMAEGRFKLKEEAKFRIKEEVIKHQNFKYLCYLI